MNSSDRNEKRSTGADNAPMLHHQYGMKTEENKNV